MKRYNHHLILVLITLLIGSLSLPNILGQSCTDRRYIDPVFSVTLTNNAAKYGTAPDFVISETSSTPQDLYFDFYEPTGDTLNKRPLIVMAFGGAFLAGSKDQAELVDFCNYMAARGYTVAAIDYRLGFNVLSDESAIRAVYRAGQDMKAAIRYLKEFHTVYKIDTNIVIAGGNSAGAISAIHSAYLTETERENSPLLEPTYLVPKIGIDWPDLGCLDCEGNDYVHNSFPDLVINLWGAIGDLNFMETTETAPIVSFHGDEDDVVPYDSGHPFDYPIFPTVYGSNQIHIHADNIGLPNEFHPFPGEGHEVWSNSTYALYIKEKARDFMYDFMKPETPLVEGPTEVCPTVIETYTINNPDPDMIYCWNVTGGTIINDNDTSIDVEWGTGGSASVQARFINENVVESDSALLNINIQTLYAPENPAANNITQTSADLSWVSGANDFNVYYRKVSDTDWQIQHTTTLLTTLNGLEACNAYQWYVVELCDGTIEGPQSSISVFNTTGYEAEWEPVSIYECENALNLFTLITSGYNNGTWTGGNYIIDNAFEPSGLTPGNYPVTYLFPCSSITHDITVLANPDPSWTGPESICENESINLIPDGTQEGNWSGAGVFNNGDGTAVFTPISGVYGDYSITYSIYAGTCEVSQTQDINVAEMPDAAWTALTVCETDAPVLLEPDNENMFGGTWTGEGITDMGDGTATFNPSGLSGNISITYTLINGACTDAFTDDMIVENCLSNINIPVKVILEGAYDETSGEMRTHLQSANLLPVTQPYNTEPWFYEGTESVDVMPDNVVDWVLIELRSEADNEMIVGTKAALLLKDGTVQDISGTNGVLFYNMDVNLNYYIVVRHRNHLAVMSATAISVEEENIGYDFTGDVSRAMGMNQLAALTDVGSYALYAGDFDANGVLNVDDYIVYRLQSSTLNIYTQGDCTLDKAVTVSDFNAYTPNASLIGIQQIRY